MNNQSFSFQMVIRVERQPLEEVLQGFPGARKQLRKRNLRHCWRRCEGLWGFKRLKGLKVPNSSFGRSHKQSAAKASGEVTCEALRSSRGGAGRGPAGV